MSETTVPALAVGDRVRTRNAAPMFTGAIVHLEHGYATLVAQPDGSHDWTHVRVRMDRLDRMPFELGAQGPTLAEMGEAFVKRIAAMSKALDDVQIKADREMEAFREQVRDLAIEKAQKLGWCTPGLNEALVELGLRPKVTRWDVELKLVATQYVSITVEADSAEEAERKVYAMDTISHAEPSAWEWDSEEVEEVNPVEG